MEKEPWQITAARFCVNNSEKGFTLKELTDHVKTLYHKVTEQQINQFYSEEIHRPAGREYSRDSFKIKDEENNRWTPPLDLVSKVTDYDELKEARKNSKQAFWLSIVAIIIALITLIVQSLEH